MMTELNDASRFCLPAPVISSDTTMMASHEESTRVQQLRELVGCLQGPLSNTSGTEIPERLRTLALGLAQGEIERLESNAIARESLSFSDLFDLERIQFIQDHFAQATGVSSLITDPQGMPLTRPSNFCRLCRMIRETPLGRERCFASDSVLGIYRTDGPTIKSCLSGGLLSAGAAISVGGKHIANWIMGQVRDESLDPQRIRDYALEIGLEPDQVEEAFLDVKSMPLERFHAISRLLFNLASLLSDQAFQNHCLSHSMKSLQLARNSLAQSEAKFRSYIQASPFGVFLVDSQGAFMDINGAGERIAGYSASDLLGMNITDLIISEDLDRALNHFRRVWEEGAAVEQIRIRQKSGKLTHILVDAVRLTEDRVLSFVQDITASVRMEEQLRQSQKMDAIGRLAGGIAHDFNNMLGVILGCAEICIDSSDPSWPMHDSLLDIRKAAEHSAELTRHLLAFARRQAHRPVSLELNDMISHQITMLRRLISENIDLQWNPMEGLWNIWMDPSQIAQILTNLCINASDAISGPGRICIETSNEEVDEEFCASNPDFQPGQFVMLSVRDTGHGMDRSTIANIFEPFFTTKKKGCGTGLGLATVYGILRQNGGSIIVQSQKGEGTEFRIYLPRCLEKVETGEQSAGADSQDGGRETILLVEDEPAMLVLGQRMLSKSGYRVLAAASPEEAMIMASEMGGEIDLLISDVILPEMNGTELARELQACYPGMRVLFMSGYSDSYLATEIGMDSSFICIQKPFSSKKINALVRQILDSPVNHS